LASIVQNLVFASFGVAFTETNAALDHFEQGCSPRGRAVWYWPKSATRDFKTGRRHGQFNGGGG
jgi:hypothetical protein